MSQFDPTIYQNKDIVYVKIPNAQGICQIWTWNPRKKKYVKRDEGNRFYAYHRTNGPQVSKCFKNFEEAKRWLDLGDLHLESVNGEEPSFVEVSGRYFDHVKPRIKISTYETLKSQAKHLVFFDNLPVVDIAAQTVDAWLRDLKKPGYLKLQHKTRMSYRHELSLLRCILTYFAEYENDDYQVPIKERHLEDCIVDFARYRQAKDKGKTKFVPREDCLRFLEEMRQRGTRKPEPEIVWAIAEFQLGAGPRIGEACALKWEDVDLKTGAVTISKTVEWPRIKGREVLISPMTKTGESRIIYTSKRSLDVLREWRLKCGRSTGLIFSFDGKTPLAYRVVQYHYDKAFRNLRLSWRSTHILRHSYATDFLEKTGNMEALQGQLGHASAKQTQHYAKITNTTKRDGVRAYDESVAQRTKREVDVVPGAENPDPLGAAGRKEKTL